MGPLTALFSDGFSSTRLTIPLRLQTNCVRLIKAAIWRREEIPRYENGDEPTRGQMRRHTIMQAAAEVFGEKGYGGATISEIAGKAGIAEASIYQYFKSKEDLLLSVPGNWFDELGRRVGTSVFRSAESVRTPLISAPAMGLGFSDTRVGDACADSGTVPQPRVL